MAFFGRPLGLIAFHERALKKDYEQKISALETKVKEESDRTALPVGSLQLGSLSGRFILPPIAGEVPVEERKPQYSDWGDYK